MRPILRTSLLLTLLAAAVVAPVRGQLVWDTPRMTGPESPTGLGLYWLRAGSLPEDADAAFFTLGLPGFDGSVSVRGGVGEGANDELAGFGGLDLRAPIARHTDSQPLDIEWTGGAGVGAGDYILVSVPMALSAGRSWSSGAVWFAPYVSLGMALDYRIGDDAPDEEFQVQPSAGVGLDLAFDPSRNLVIRAAASLGDRQAIAVGLVVGGGGG